MKFSKYLSKAVAFVIALFQKQFICLSNKPTTLCGRTGDSLRSPTGLHSLGGISTEFKVRFAPPTVCRRTINNRILLFEFTIQISYKIFAFFPTQ